jgi:hypothetical protein
MNRRNNPDVDLDRFGAAQPVEGPVLQYPKQLHLHTRRDLADLVEEDGPAVRQFEAAQSSFRGTGEGALLVAEQFGLEQGLG